jgi:DNA-binding NarL/FixJ family response regulator
MDGLLITLLAILGGAVLHLYLQLRKYQRLDYGALITQDERDRQAADRLQRLEALIAQQQDEREQQRSNTAEALREVRIAAKQLREQFDSFREMANSQLSLKANDLPAPVRHGSVPSHVSQLAREIEQISQRGRGPETQPAAQMRTEAPAQKMPISSMAGKVNELLKQGLSVKAIAKELGLSLREVEMLAALLRPQSA